MYFAKDFQNDFDVSRETLDKFQAYHDLILKWQKRINLISPQTVPDTWHRHFADSAQLSNYLNKNDILVDIGAGGGFPGLVLSIMGHKTHLVDSDTRKCVFLKTVARELDLNCEIHNARAEDLNGLNADIVVSRATASISNLCDWGLPLTRKKSFWLLKGETAPQECDEAAELFDFDVEMLASATHPGGFIVHLHNVSRET